MAKESDFYKQLIDNLYDGVYFLDRQRRITYWNHAATQLTGYGSEEVLGKCCADNVLMHVDDAGESLCEGKCPAAQTLVDGEPRQADVFLHHRAGHRVPVSVRVSPIRGRDGAIVGAVEVFSDNGAKMAMGQRIEQLQQVAMYDPLTGVGNRRHAEAVLQSRMDEMARYGWPFGLVFSDVDHFKQFNDRHGHEVGDKVLKMVANTLAHNVRPFDTVSRWGGEEFVGIMANVDRDRLFALADRLRALVEQSALGEETETLRVTVSMGGVLATPDDTPETLIERADELMYRSKEAGRNRVSID